MTDMQDATPRGSSTDEDRPAMVPGASMLKTFAILAGTAVALYLCYRLSLPFLSALTWAMVLAIILAPAHCRIEKRIARPTLSASVAVAATAIAAGIPLFFMGQQLAREVADGAVYLNRTITAFDWSELVGRHPWLTQVAVWLEGRFDVANLLAGLTQWLAQQSTSLFRGSLNQAVGIVLTFYMLFYFLRDRRDILATLVAFSPLTTTETTRVARRLTEAVHASVFGTIVIGLVQGTVGGIVLFGASGLVLGPAVIAVTLELIDILKQRSKA